MTTDVQNTTAAGVTAHDWGWRHASRKDFALRHVDFDIKPGERVLLLGASGAGKSTLMSGLAGVLGGDDEGEQEGELLIDGVDARQARGRCGWCFRTRTRRRFSNVPETTPHSAART